MNETLQTIADIAVAKLLSKTPFVGFVGNAIFLASSYITNTFHTVNRKASPRFVEHEVIYGKPLTEFTGVDLRDFTIEMTLHSTLRSEPLSFYGTLLKMAESGKPYTVFIDYKNEGKYTVRNVEGEEKIWHGGRPAVMDITLTLREYVESLPTEAERKLREDELKREDTGKGGPDKLAGNGEITPATLSPLIDPVTRMVTMG